MQFHVGPVEMYGRLAVWSSGTNVTRPARMRLICHDFCETVERKVKTVHACHIFPENRYFGIGEITLEPAKRP
jgi:hypothetical protein